VEKDGTFVNCHGRVQRIAPKGQPALPPLGDSREDWRVLADLAARMGRAFACQGPPQVFQAIAKAVDSFRGLDYDIIGAQGADVAISRPAAEGALR
jgi:predicted molibdopterin-dependent oxidoreductase YjgC